MPEEVIVTSFVFRALEPATERGLRVLAKLKGHYLFHYYITGELDDMSAARELVRAYGMTERVTLTGNISPEEFSRQLAATDIALFLHERAESETANLLRRIMISGVPPIVFATGWCAALPNDSAVKIDQDEHMEALLSAYLERLITDAPLRERIGANARRYALATAAAISYTSSEPPAPAANTPEIDRLARASTPSSNGRFKKLEGLDYKRGAIEYPRKLDAGHRYHLLTKPFYNLAIKLSKYEGEGIDADTHRHFCDFANMTATLPLPLGARILDVGCGSGWLCEYFARFGYDVTGIDISPELIEMARDRLHHVPYGVDQETPLRYRFLTHDIESAPLAESFDIIICYDSLHHFVDERAVLHHLAAMLDDGGYLFVLEGNLPPEGSETEKELRDTMQHYETLESPFSREYLMALLGEYGFAVVGDYISVNGLFERDSLQDERLLPIEPSAVNCLLCKKVAAHPHGVIPDSRHPGLLRARLTRHGDWAERIAPGAPLQLRFEVENTGDTLWLASRAALKGRVRLGVKILNEAGVCVDEFHGQPPLVRALTPGEKVLLSLDHPAPRAPGTYILKIDLIDQDICWFEEKGSQPLTLSFQVQF